MAWHTLEEKIHDIWKSQRDTPLNTLKQNLYDVIREARDSMCAIGGQSGEYEEVSRLCATPAIDGVMSCGTLDVILGFVCEEDTEVMLEIGAKCLQKLYRPVKAMQLVPIFQDDKGHAYPIMNLTYHMIQLKTLKRPGRNMYAVGVRVREDLKGSLENLRLPGIGVFRGALFFHDDDLKKSTEDVDELKKMGVNITLNEGDIFDLKPICP